jgi:hypothetical protein
MGLRPERRHPGLHRTGCRHCPRGQDRCALCLSQSHICIGARHRRRNLCKWHKADIPLTPVNVRFWGVKRTSHWWRGQSPGIPKAYRPSSSLTNAVTSFSTCMWPRDVALGSLSPFVHWSFVAPNIFGVRMIMVPPHAMFAAVPIVVGSGFAGGLNGTLSFQGGGGSLVGTKHISSPLERDNAWLHATAHRAAVESPEPVAAIRRKLGGDQAFPKVSSPMSGLKRSTWAKCLGQAGRLQCGPTKGDLVWAGTKVKKHLMSAFGTKRTFSSRSAMSAFGGKADISSVESCIESSGLKLPRSVADR